MTHLRPFHRAVIGGNAGRILLLILWHRSGCLWRVTFEESRGREKDAPSTNISDWEIAMSNFRIEADAEWTMFIHQRYGYITAYLYMMLSTCAFGDRYQGSTACRIACNSWETLHMETYSWYWALKNL